MRHESLAGSLERSWALNRLTHVQKMIKNGICAVVAGIGILAATTASAANVLPTPGSSAGYLYFPAAPAGAGGGSTPPVADCYVGMDITAATSKCTIGGDVALSSADSTTIGRYAGLSGGNPIIADLADISSSYPYGCTGTNIGATSLSSGTFNTEKIHANSCSFGAKAASLCYNKPPVGEWYLPAKEELQTLYNRRASLGGFSSNSSYWSSTEYNSGAWYLYFQNGWWNDTSKTYNYSVRCARSF